MDPIEYNFSSTYDSGICIYIKGNNTTNEHNDEYIKISQVQFK